MDSLLHISNPRKTSTISAWREIYRQNRNIKIQAQINSIDSLLVACSSVSQMEEIGLQYRHATIGETGFCWYLNLTVRLDGQLMLPWLINVHRIQITA